VIILTKEELLKVEGGAIKWGILGLVGAGISFFIGLIDGIVRPLSCN